MLAFSFEKDIDIQHIIQLFYWLLFL